jgi:hypothetical protein
MRATYSIEMAWKARELAERGLPDYDIAIELGISHATLSRWKHDHNEFFWAIRIARLKFPRTRGSGNVRATHQPSTREQEFLRRIEHLRHRGVDISLLRMFAAALCTRQGLARLAKVARAGKLPREVKELMEQRLREFSEVPQPAPARRGPRAPYAWRNRDLRNLANPNENFPRIDESMSAGERAALEKRVVAENRRAQAALGTLGSRAVR